MSDAVISVPDLEYLKKELEEYPEHIDRYRRASALRGSPESMEFLSECIEKSCKPE